MNISSRIRALLFLALLVASVQVVRHLYDWHQHRDERVELVALKERLVDAGASLVREQVQAERIREWLEVEDGKLSQQRGVVESYGRFAHQSSLPAHLYGAYRQDLDDLNERIRVRNLKLEELRLTINDRNAAADRYNLLADSMRALAVEAGDPYHAIPLPAEAAAARGIELRTRP